MAALDHNTQGKQFILTNHDGSTPSKVILARQDSTPGKVFLTTPDAAGVNQLFFTTPDLSAQHLQVNNCKVSFHLALEKVKMHIINRSSDIKTFVLYSVGKILYKILCSACYLRRLPSPMCHYAFPNAHVVWRVLSCSKIHSD